MPYEKQEIINKVIEASRVPRDLYKSKVVNYRGKTAEGHKYSEIVSEYLCENIEVLNSIRSVTREKPYKVISHKGKTQREQSNRVEERIALDMYGHCYKHIGEIVDYQVPLKNRRSDKGLGKIDLLAKQNDVIAILELKKPESQETLLRAVLETFTYYKLVDQKKLLDEFTAQSLEKAALVYKGGAAHEEYLNGPNNSIKKLMALLDVKLFVYFKSGMYSVEFA